MSNQPLSWNSIFRRAFTNTTTQHRGIFFLSVVSVLLSSSVVLAESSSDEPSFPSSKDFPTLEEARANSKTGIIQVLVSLKIERETRSSRRVQRDAIADVQKQFKQHLTEKVNEGVISGDLPVGTAVADSAENVTEYTEFPVVRLNVNGSLLEAVKKIPVVENVVLDYLFSLHLSESVPLIGADNAWQEGYTGDNQAVAVLDTGVDKEHPDLNGKVIAEACFSRNSGNTSSLCPNVLNSEIGDGTASYLCGTNDRCRHGTHVAGIVAANGDVKGVAKGADLVAIQVFHQNEAAGGLRTFFSDLLLALQHVLLLHEQGKPIAAVNLSLGGGQFDSVCDGPLSPLKDAIDMLRAVGIATIVASGNEGYKDAISAPACISSAISVGATDKDDIVAGFSNSASILDLLAPGRFINSTIPGGGHASFSGTSMAAPHVAGAWAVLKSANPTATVDDILNALQDTGKPISDTKNGIVKPRIQLDYALAALVGTQVLYGVHDEGLNDSYFFTINPSNLEVTKLPEVCDDCDIEGLDIHPLNDDLYASAGDDTKKPGHLYLVDKNTGGLTDLGSTGFYEVDALSFNPATGVLWGWAQDAGLLRFDSLPDSSATLVWAPEEEWEVEDLTWNTAGTILYGVKNLHGNHKPDSHGPLDAELGIELLAYDTTVPDPQPTPVCQSLVKSMEIEALDTLPDDRLIFGYHNRNELVIGVLDVGSCSIVVQEEFSTPYNDVEGLAWQQ